MKFYTVGYEGCEIHEFVSFLKRKKIRLVVDVRKNPVSRKKGFSKSKLAQFLLEKGIKYQHIPSLGVPTEWRKMAKAELITRKKMFSDYVRDILPLAENELQKLTRDSASIEVVDLNPRGPVRKNQPSLFKGS